MPKLTCSKCKKSLFRLKFSASQISKKEDRKCETCIIGLAAENPVQNEETEIDPTEKFHCSICSQDLVRDKFSYMQLQPAKIGKRKCKECIKRMQQKDQVDEGELFYCTSCGRHLSKSRFSPDQVKDTDDHGEVSQQRDCLDCQELASQPPKPKPLPVSVNISAANIENTGNADGGYNGFLDSMESGEARLHWCCICRLELQHSAFSERQRKRVRAGERKCIECARKFHAECTLTREQIAERKAEDTQVREAERDGGIGAEAAYALRQARSEELGNMRDFLHKRNEPFLARRPRSRSPLRRRRSPFRRPSPRDMFPPRDLPPRDLMPNDRLPRRNVHGRANDLVLVDSRNAEEQIANARLLEENRRLREENIHLDVARRRATAVDVNARFQHENFRMAEARAHNMGPFDPMRRLQPPANVQSWPVHAGQKRPRAVPAALAGITPNGPLLGGARARNHMRISEPANFADEEYDPMRHPLEQLGIPPRYI